MCGINGIYGVADKEKSLLLIDGMNKRLAHRGPDDSGVYFDNGCGLGHRRLSIIDLSSAGHQPMSISEERYTIVYNGELYNYLEIKSELSSEPFRTNTDTEVILHAYKKWGAACLQKFNGMYAFAIWDKQSKELFVARDRMGIKPLYYFNKDGVTAFSSELRALLSTGLINKELDSNSLIDYLRYQTVHAPQTIVKDVFMLMPGHWMKISAKGIETKQYWTIGEKRDTAINTKSYKEVCDDIYDLLLASVKRRLIADVPFGAFLSGGIDSSAVVGLMSKVVNQPVKTFCVTFNETEFSEAKYAAIVAKKFNTDHKEIRLTPEYFKEQLPLALAAMDHPGGDGPNTYVVSKATKQAGITMALSGLGGDELFAGYDVFKRTLQLSKRSAMLFAPKALRMLAAQTLKTVRPGVSSEKAAELLLLSRFDINNTYPLSRQVLLDKQISQLTNIGTLPANRVKEILNQHPYLKFIPNELSQVTIAEITTYLQNVLLRDTDQMSMAPALEVRVPFMDYTLVEYLLNVKDEFKYPHTPKKLLIDSLGDLLPPEIINRPKMGFTLPWNEWMRKDLKQFCEERMISLSKRDYFNEKEIQALWTNFIEGDKRLTWSRLWPLIVLEDWIIRNEIN